jgi:hypothetical protein
MYQPLIRFRHAIQKAAAAGLQHMSETASQRAIAPRNTPREPQAPQPKGLAGSRSSIRLDRAPERMPVSESEMEAVRVRTIYNQRNVRLRLVAHRRNVTEINVLTLRSSLSSSVSECTAWWCAIILALHCSPRRLADLYPRSARL